MADKQPKKPSQKPTSTLASTPVVAHEKRIRKKPAGYKGSFFLVLTASLLWGFMAGVSWGKLQDLYAQGYNTFNNARLLLMLPFLMLVFSLSLFWIVRTPKRNEVKPHAISSLVLWLIYFFWEAIVAGRLGSD